MGDIATRMPDGMSGSYGKDVNLRTVPQRHTPLRGATVKIYLYCMRGPRNYLGYKLR